MKYIELTVHTTTEASELVSDVMWDHTSGGVAVLDMNDILTLQKDSTVFWDYMDEAVLSPRSDVLVKCYIETASAEQTIKDILSELEDRKKLCEGAIPFGTLEAVKREVEGDDWIDVWKKHFRPIPLGRIVIVPEWIAYEKKAGEEIVLLDSNMAFGTGEHETTSMCIELMQGVVQSGDVCIDVGCGSGILGISAAKLGASFCYLSDLDPIAVESALHNVKKNGVEDRTQVTLANLLQDSAVKADVIFANITADVLALLAPAIPGALKAGGTLILSGILSDRRRKVEEAYSAFGFQVICSREKGEWVALVLKKR